MPPLSGGDFQRGRKAQRGGNPAGHSGGRLLPPKSARRAESGGNSFGLGKPGGAASSHAADLAPGSTGGRGAPPAHTHRLPPPPAPRSFPAFTPPSPAP